MNAHDKTKTALTFAVYHNDNLVRRETVAHDIVKIGNDPRSHLRVDSSEAARMHAVLEVGSISQLTLIDLGNEPGTLVNGHRINKCQLRLGDQIQIGSTRLELERAEDGQIVAPPPAIASAAPFAGFSPEPYVLAVANPFLAQSTPFQAPVSAQPVPSDEDGYAMIKSGPAMSLDEVEIAHASAVEVLVKWDTNVLHVAHLSPPRSFYLGESGAKGEECDYLLPIEVLGEGRTPLVIERAGSSFLVIPRDATGTVTLPREASRSIADLVASGRARPSTEVSGACELELQAGARAKMKLARSEVTFEVNVVNAGRRVAGGFLAGMEATAYKFVGLSFLAHMGTVASLAFFMPHISPDDAEGIDRDQIALMRHYLDAHAIVEQEEIKDVADGAQDNAQGGEGQRAKDEEGQMGSTVSKDQGRRYAMEKRSDEDPHVAREKALKEAAEFGIIGMLANPSGRPNEPIAAWDRDDSNGRDTLSAMGNMWGADIGEAAGMGAFGLSGTGLGGGDKGEGIGLGKDGFGHGAGCPAGQVCGQGFGPGGEGFGHGRLPRDHVAKGPKPPKTGIVDVKGRLPPEVIQRIVRQNYGRFKVCYETALRSNPTLSGRVAVNFAIGRDGAVMTANDGGSDMPDQTVISCVARGFMNLSFPQPEGGIVTVKYPLIFTPE